MNDAISILRKCDIQPTPQRIAVVECVIEGRSHLSADEVLHHARKKCPTISRATVYNTLNLMVQKGLLGMQVIKEGAVVFDPNVDRHHHVIDEETGDIYDIPWEHLQVHGMDRLKDFEIAGYQVVLKGKKRT